MTKNLIPLESYARKYTMIDGEVQTSAIGVCNPLPEQQILAEEFLKCVNLRKEWEGGSFRVVLTKVKKEFYDPLSKLFKRYVPTVFEVQFLDKDGDVQFVTEYPDDFITLIHVIGVTRMADEAEEAYQHWKKFWGLIDVAPSEQYRKALGEKPITGIDAPTSMVSGL